MAAPSAIRGDGDMRSAALYFSCSIGMSLLRSGPLDRSTQRSAFECVAFSCRPQDPALRNAWRGHCGFDELDQELQSFDAPADRFDPARAAVAGTRISDIADTAACTSALGRPPVPQTSECGLGSKTFSEHLARRRGSNQAAEKQMRPLYSCASDKQKRLCVQRREIPNRMPGRTARSDDGSHDDHLFHTKRRRHAGLRNNRSRRR